MSQLIQLEAVELLCRVARATRGAGEQPPGSNAGPYVEGVQTRNGGKKGEPWCAYQVCDWGRTALPTQPQLAQAWPFVITGGCQFAYEWAAKHNIIFETPERGDIALVWHAEMQPAPRFAHAGLITGTAFDAERRVDFISGNTTSPKDPNQTDPKLSREGWCVAEKLWRFSDKDRFARWRLLLK